MMNKQIKQMVRIFVIVFITATFAAGALAVANIEVDDHCGKALIPITVTIADNVGSCDVMLKYDPKVAKVVGVRDGDMDFTTPDTTRRGEGIVRVAAHQKPDSEGMYGTFVIAIVVIDVNSGGRYAECPLEIIVTEFREHTPVAKPMVYSTSGGKYTTECLMVPGFLGVFAIAIILAAAYMIERRRRR